MKNEFYTLTHGKNANGMAHAIKDYLSQAEGMETQLLRTEAGEYIVQARVSNGKFKQLAGLDRVLSVKIRGIDDTHASMEIGAGKWADKIGGGFVGMFLFWPFAFTAAYGAYKQQALPRKVTQAIESYLAA